MRTSKKKPLASAQGEKRRKVKFPKYSRLNKELIREFDNFLQCAPPRRLSRNLRNMFLIYLSHEQDGLPKNFGDIIIDFYLLLEFLDTISDEYHQK